MVYDKKRKLLEKNLPESSLLILVGKSEILRNGDVFYPFRQDSDFLLLTGLNIPDLCLIAIKEKDETKWVLYSEPISDKEKLWGTSRIDYEAIREKSWIPDIRSFDMWKSDLNRYTKDLKTIAIRNCDEENTLGRFILKHKEKFISLEDRILSLRMKKTEEEIEKMRHAIAVTKIALEFVQQNIETYIYEREIEADIAQIYRKNGCTEAYPTIVASGPNACTLHYTKYDRKIEDWDFILIDTGAEFEGYAADITRTFIKWETTSRKEELYQAVKQIQMEAINTIQPGRTWDEHEKIMRELMEKYLMWLGLLPKDTPDEEREFLSRKFFPHRMSHFLGLDVHDSGSRSSILEPGMVITCEPGIYISDEGIGIRIEDDILITEDGCEVLSREIPK